MEELFGFPVEVTTNNSPFGLPYKEDDFVPFLGSWKIGFHKLHGIGNIQSPLVNDAVYFLNGIDGIVVIAPSS